MKELTGEEIYKAIDQVRFKNDFSYASLSRSHRSNKEITLKAVSRVGMNLAFASKELRNDIDVVLNVVQNYGFAIEHVSDRLKNDLEVVFAAVSKSSSSLNFASKEIKAECRKHNNHIEFLRSWYFAEKLQKELPKN